MELIKVEITDRASIALDSLVLSMMREGWKCGALSPEVEEMDRNIVEGNGILKGMSCPRCKGAMQYHPFHREGRYRAVCLCSECGERREL